MPDTLSLNQNCSFTFLHVQTVDYLKMK